MSGFGGTKPQKLFSKILPERFGHQISICALCLVGFDPRKNIDTLFRAYSKLPINLREAYTLVIGSRASIHAMDALQVAADASGLNPKEWISTGYLETSRLIELYRDSSLFIFPSKHEGFGLPLLEAMTLGIPCIASSTTSVGEVMGILNIALIQTALTRWLAS